MSPVNKDTCATVVEAQGDGAVVETVRRAAIDGDELRRGVQHDAPCPTQTGKAVAGGNSVVDDALPGDQFANAVCRPRVVLLAAVDVVPHLDLLQQVHEAADVVRVRMESLNRLFRLR